MKTEAQMAALKPTFEAIYAAVKAEDPTATARVSGTLIVASAGGNVNPIRDVPPTAAGRITVAKEALARARETNIRWEGGDTVIRSLGDVVHARKQAEAWAGPSLVLSAVNLRDGSFNLYLPDEQIAAEAQRRYDWLHQAGSDLIEYLCLIGWMGESQMSPEPGIGSFFSPCSGPNPWAGIDLQGYIDESIRRAAAGTASGQ